MAYVVDADGALIAHPDISLVLKKSDMSALPQVAALVHPEQPAPRLGRDLQGDEVFSAHAPIPTLRWTVFVESPRGEAYAPLYATLRRTALVLVAALLAYATTAAAAHFLPPVSTHHKDMLTIAAASVAWAAAAGLTLLATGSRLPAQIFRRR